MATALSLDHEEFTPLYRQLQFLIRRQIDTGELRPGDPIPSESEQIKRYQVSRMTVRHALQRLVQEGYIYRQRGRGTFVAHAHLDHRSQHHGEVMEELRRQGWDASSRILSLGPADPADVYHQLLDFSGGQWILTYRRLILGNGEPIMVSRVLAVMDEGMSITNEELVSESVFTLLRRRYGRDFGPTEITFSAVAASEEQVGLLQVAPGKPLLSKESLTRLRAGTRAIFSRSFFRGDKYKYMTTALTA